MDRYTRAKVMRKVMGSFNRRLFLKASTVVLFTPAISRAQSLPAVKLLVLRNPPAIGTNNCVATCIRGSIYDVSHDQNFVDPALWSVLPGAQPICDVIERPWVDNKHNVSSIPSGTYTGFVRNDRSKKWMTNENRSWRIELNKVAGKRQNIQFHYGKDENWSQGCFIVGDHLVKDPTISDLSGAYCKLKNGESAISRLRKAVLSPYVNNDKISILVADRDGLFPVVRNGC